MNIRSLHDAGIHLMSSRTGTIYTIRESKFSGHYNVETFKGDNVAVLTIPEWNVLEVLNNQVKIGGEYYTLVNLEQVLPNKVALLKPAKYAFEIQTLVMVEAVSEEEAWENVREVTKSAVDDFDFKRSYEDDKEG